MFMSKCMENQLSVVKEPKLTNEIFKNLLVDLNIPKTPLPQYPPIIKWN